MNGFTKTFFLFTILILLSSRLSAQRKKSIEQVDKFGIQLGYGLDVARGLLTDIDHKYVEGGLYYNIPLSKKVSLLTNVIYNRSSDKREKLRMFDLEDPEIEYRYWRHATSSKLKFPIQLKYALNKKSSFYMLLGFSTGFHFGMKEEIVYRDTHLPGSRATISENPPTFEYRDDEPILLIQDAEFFHQKIIEQFEFAFGFKLGDFYLEPGFKIERNHYRSLVLLEMRVRYCMVKTKRPEKQTPK